MIQVSCGASSSGRISWQYGSDVAIGQELSLWVRASRIWRTDGASSVAWVRQANAGGLALRWCAAWMIEASKQFRRVNGFMHLPALTHCPRSQVARADEAPIAVKRFFGR